jgi:hypothetical protein
MSIHPRAFRFAAAILLAAAAVARAQVPPDPRTQATIHLGPFYLAPTFEVRELGIDSNVFNETRARQDFTVTLAPLVQTQVPFGRRGLVTAVTGADIVYYQRYASERSINPQGRLRGDLFLNRVSLFAEAGHLRTRQRMNVEIDARARRAETAASVGALVRVSTALSMEIEARADRRQFDADARFNGTSLQHTLNREGVGLTTTARYDATPLTTFALRAEAVRERFPLSPARDANSVRVTPGIELKPNALIAGSAFVGYRAFAPEAGALPAFRGLVAAAGLTYLLSDSTRFSFRADRDVQYSFEPAQPYFLSRGYGLTVERRLIGRTDIALAGLLFRNAYRDLEVLDGPAGQPRVDSIRTLSASVGYRFGRDARVGVGIEHRRRSSNSAAHRDYQGVRLALSANYGF